MRPSRSTDDAFFATALDVFFAVCRWESALPAALFDFAPVDLLRRVFDALFTALEPVFFVAMIRLVSVRILANIARRAPRAAAQRTTRITPCITSVWPGNEHRYV